MKRLNVILILFCAAFLLQACATKITQEKIATADYGPPPSAGYEQKIKDRFSRVLIDPTAPIYEFSTPRKGYTKEAPLFGTHECFGWQVCGTLNSKNRFGGYVGRAPFFVLFRDDEIVAFMYGKAGDDINIQNVGIKKACARPWIK